MRRRVRMQGGDRGIRNLHRHLVDLRAGRSRSGRERSRADNFGIHRPVSRDRDTACQSLLSLRKVVALIRSGAGPAGRIGAVERYLRSPARAMRVRRDAA